MTDLTIPSATPMTLPQQAVTQLLENFECQPVLFVGAGLARRYIAAPDWEGALRFALSQISGVAISYEYLVQKFGDDKVLIGTEIADLLFEWAWGNGKNSFDANLFTSTDKSIFLKHVLAKHLIDLTPSDVKSEDNLIEAELQALQTIRPHALITTNYDGMLEGIYKGYESIVGKSVLRYNLNAYGEVYHIHGSVLQPESMIVTTEDYKAWHDESRYFAAKLLTYFVEHPVFIFGYGLGDPNVQTVLRDIGKIVADDTGLISNVIQVVWHSDPSTEPIQSEFSIPVGTKQYRIRVLNVTSLLEVFQSLAARHELKNVNPALVRALAARVMKLTRKDIPNGDVQVDFTTLERLSKSDDELPKVLGITNTDNLNKAHPYILTSVADRLGFQNWNYADKLLKRIKKEKGVDLKATDNRYHCAVKTGVKDSSITRKYSQEAVDLLSLVRDSQPYELTL